MRHEKHLLSIVDFFKEKERRARERMANWLLRDVRLKEGLKVGQNTISLSPAGVGDVVRWSATKTAVALGDIGMDVTTGRPSAFIGGVNAPLATQAEVAGLTTFFSERTTDVTTTSTSFTALGLSVTTGGSVDLAISFSASFSNASGGSIVYFRVRLDGVSLRGMGSDTRDNGTLMAGAIVQQVTVGAGAHTVDVQWRTTSGTARVRPVAAADQEHAALLVMEV